MKTITTFLTIFYLSLANAQVSKIFESENVLILADEFFEKDKFSIILSEASLNFKNIFLLSENDPSYIQVYGVFPQKNGFYTMLITYKDFFYQEVIWYMNNPENEKLEFNFHKLKNLWLCRIDSKESVQLNKEVILHKLTSEERKKMLDKARKKK